MKNKFFFSFFVSGDYVCEIETYGSPLSQTSTLEILGEFFIHFFFKIPGYSNLVLDLNILLTNAFKLALPTPISHLPSSKLKTAVTLGYVTLTLA